MGDEHRACNPRRLKYMEPTAIPLHKWSWEVAYMGDGMITSSPASINKRGEGVI